jgi:hypothetical protein
VVVRTIQTVAGMNRIDATMALVLRITLDPPGLMIRSQYRGWNIFKVSRGNMAGRTEVAPLR